MKALQGDTQGARKLLYQYMDLGTGALDGSGRLLFGLIAEQLGLLDLARDNYTQVTRPKFSEGGSSYALAQKRLAGIGDKPQ